MTSSADVLIPSFSSDVIKSLPIYYRAVAEHLADSGRVIIRDPSELPEKEQG